MKIEHNYFTTDILDFNPKRMTEKDIKDYDIPDDLIHVLGDHRQYVPSIAKHIGDQARWYEPGRPHFFLDVMKDPEDRSKRSHSLILSGSGLSAHHFHTEQRGKFSEGYYEALENASLFIKDFIVQGKWVLGICFGGQLAVNAVGGKIGRLPENEYGNAVTESGWLPHALTEKGKEDKIIGNLQDPFYAPHLHNDFVAALPSVGTEVETSSGVLRVTRSDILATRNGYMGGRRYNK